MSNDTHRWLRYLSHPEVAIDPAVTVPDWSLHPDGRARLVAFLERRPAWLDGVEVILTSPEPEMTTRDGRQDIGAFSERA